MKTMPEAHSGSLRSGKPIHVDTPPRIRPYPADAVPHRHCDDRSASSRDQGSTDSPRAHVGKAMTLLPLQPGDLECGVALGFDIVSSQRHLLLARGQVPQSEKQMQALYRTGFRLLDGVDSPAAETPVFARVRKLATRLSVLFERIVKNPAPVQCAGEIAAIAAATAGLDADDPQAAFASVHLDLHHSYDVVHHLMAALLCARVAVSEGMTLGEQVSLIAAALTNDIALLRIRRLIDASHDVSAGGRALIESHCDDALADLYEIGVRDGLWLRAVGDHHEYLDGSGYRGLHGWRVVTEARMLAIADAFGAMLRERPYRRRRLASSALASLYEDPHGRYDRRLVCSLTRDYGRFPPGTPVLLASNEIGIVIRTAPEHPCAPVVASITDLRGQPLIEPFIRDTRNERHRIVTLMPPESAARIGRAIETCWSR